MWLSPRRRSHSFCKNTSGIRGLPSSTYQKLCFGRIQDYAGAKITLVLCADVLELAFWHDSGSSRRYNPVDPWRWNPENDVLAYFR
eukprot:4797607-Pyramimonas_sp.AAC.1